MSARTEAKEYRAWADMKDRCVNPNNRHWKRYGGRGIRVCERWQGYDAFLEDMGRKPGPRYSLDRIDPNGHYEPGNCRWTTWEVQCNNKENSHRVNHEGETLTTTQWARRLGMSKDNMYNRVKKYGPEAAVAMGPPRHRADSGLNVKQRRQIAKRRAAGESAKVLAAEFGISRTTVARIHARWS